MGALRCKLIPKRMARARIVLAKADGGIHHTGQSVGLAVCRPLGCHSLVRSRRMPVCVSLTCSLTLLRSGQNALNLPAVASQQYNSTHCVKPGTTYYIKRPVACQARIAAQFRVYGSPARRMHTLVSVVPWQRALCLELAVLCTQARKTMSPTWTDRTVINPNTVDRVCPTNSTEINGQCWAW